MLLRLILVSLVTSMGLELPSSQDVSCWAESGRSWANAKLADLTVPEVAVVSATDLGEECPSEEADLVFQSVVGEMAGDFATDQCDLRGSQPASDAYCDAMPVEVVETVVVVLPEGEELAAVVVMDDVVEPSSIASLDDEPSFEEDEVAPSRTDRIASAIRLSREAVQAWADLVQECGEDAEFGR